VPEQVAQLGGTTLDVTYEQRVAHGYDPHLSAYSNKPGTPRHRAAASGPGAGRRPRT
jgi:hypothetical protein